MSEKLLPCPFCGGGASVHRCEHAFHDAKIRCAGCQAEGPIFDVDDGEANEAGRNEADAIAAWNRRTPAPEGEVASWIEPALVEHLRSLGCVCRNPLVGYRPNAGPRCRLCNVEPASPVVPVGSGESERKLVGQDYINAIKAHRVEHGSSLAVARNAVDCGWRPPAPVVPVGVSREEIARIIQDSVWADDATEFTNFLHGTDDAADAIIAALRPTDTGRE